MTQSVDTTSASDAERSLPSPKERRRLREAAELTHDEVAVAVGVTPTTVRSWETGRTAPRGRKLEVYARFLTRLRTRAEPTATRTDAPAGPQPAEPPATGAEAAPSAAAPGGAVTPASTARAESAAAHAGTPAGPEAVAPAEAAPRPGDADADSPDTPSSALHAPGAVRAFADAGTLTGAAATRAAQPPAGAVRHNAEHPLPAIVGAHPPPGTPGAIRKPDAPAPPPAEAPSSGTTGPTTTAAAEPDGQPSPAGAQTHGPTGSAAPAAPASAAADPSPTAGPAPADAPRATAEPDARPAPANTGTGAEPGAGTGATGSAGTPEPPPTGPPRADAAEPEQQPDQATPQAKRLPADDFDALHAHAAAALTRQAYLLTGRRRLALEAVDRAFQQAWDRWPEVATDPDPVGWVRAAAYEYALSPWHQFRRAHRHPDKPPAEPADRIVLDAMLALPTNHRRTVLLYDGVGLDLPDTAAETEASTPTAGNRLLHAHATLAARIPALAAVAPEKQSALLRDLFTALKPAVVLDPRPAAGARKSSERRARRRTRAVVGLASVIAVATAYTTATAPTKYEPPNAPGANVSGVPPHSGPQQLTEESKALHDKLRSDPAAGPARIAPKTE
ncbi:helix-turn-helix domain-containing protein [Streptomyces sp. NPDC059447]|uniref:helix-turn-helix domain-containing protein n=1 Tax=Streptomyces sp. NPDC059447 TaxID=3346834 RepID=UPI00368BBE15